LFVCLFASYRDPEDAKKAVAKLNGLELGGRAIQVRPALSEIAHLQGTADAGEHSAAAAGADDDLDDGEGVCVFGWEMCCIEYVKLTTWPTWGL
jgi:hypothetical protein